MPEAPGPRAVADRAEPWPEHSAEELLLAVADGSVEAFELLYAQVAGPVHGLALRVVRDPGLAEDISQEVLVDVWRLAPRFDPARGTALTWVLTMAHRRAVDRVRREVSQQDRAVRAAALHTRGEDDVVAAEVETAWQAAQVRRALGSLTALQREAIELAYYGGLTHEQVSSTLQVPLGTAKTRLRDGMIRLRDTMGVQRP